MARPKKRTSRSASRASSPRATAMAAAMSAPSNTASVQPLSAKQLLKVFVAWFIGHSIIIYLANMLFPAEVVLGTNLLSPMMGLFYGMLVFTLIVVGALPVIEYVAELQKKRLSTIDWMVLYAVINTVGLWVVARFAEQLGIGLSSWLVALALGVVIDALQGLLIMKAT